MTAADPPKVVIRRDLTTGAVSWVSVGGLAPAYAVLLDQAGDVRLGHAVALGLVEPEVVEYLRTTTARWRARQSAPAEAEPPTWTVGQVAELLGVDCSTVRRWVASGRLVAQQGRRRGVWAIDPASVRRLIAART